MAGDWREVQAGVLTLDTSDTLGVYVPTFLRQMCIAVYLGLGMFSFACLFRFIRKVEKYSYQYDIKKK